jgi:hypothetical protein
MYMAENAIRTLLNKEKKHIAFIIGNGVHRYNPKRKSLSWDDLLLKLWLNTTGHRLTKRPEGISTTEFYDLLELRNTEKIQIQKEVSELMRDWTAAEHHRRIIDVIQRFNAPILTTNYDHVLAEISKSSLHRLEGDHFTDFYPWSSYHSPNPLTSPTSGFGIWYINGLRQYHRSIRLGLTHYMGSVERARTMLFKNKSTGLYSTEKPEQWQGHQTWLDIIFNRSLFIFGLGLEENETFLRWLLIERKKYYNRFPERKRKGWYLTPKSDQPGFEGKKFFLQSVGIEVIEVQDFDDVYLHPWSS